MFPIGEVFSIPDDRSNLSDRSVSLNTQPWRRSIVAIGCFAVYSQSATIQIFADSSLISPTPPDHASSLSHPSPPLYFPPTRRPVSHCAADAPPMFGSPPFPLLTQVGISVHIPELPPLEGKGSQSRMAEFSFSECGVGPVATSVQDGFPEQMLYRSDFRTGSCRVFFETQD